MDGLQYKPSWNKLRVEGDWPGEVMGVQKDGSPKDHWLYKPGDTFRVDDKGWLVKISD